MSHRPRRAVASLAVVVLAALAACSAPSTAPVTPPEPPLGSAPAPDPSSERDAGGEVLPPVTEPATPPAVIPPPVPVAPPPAEEPPSRGELRREAGLLLAAALETAGVPLSVLVTDEHGREVLAHEPDLPLLPASTLKLVTAAAVLATLGPDARLATHVDATAPIDGDGSLRGDLVLVGGGDPSLATDEYARWVYPARPNTRLAELADRLVEAGLTHLHGDVLGVAPGFDGPAVATGWPDRYFSDFDARHIAGLTVDAGLRTIVTYPEPDEPDGEPGEGDPAEPAGPVTASQAPTPPPQPEPPDVRIDHVADPAGHAAAELARLLAERGVQVDGTGRSGEPADEVVGRLVTLQGARIADQLRFAVQRSDNQLTDSLFHTIGLVRTGAGSWERGERALRQVLDRWGIDHDGARFADGSGLSRDDRLPARLLTDLGRAMAGSRYAADWWSLMAAMGESGTLSQRLVGTVASGRFLGKTGALRDVVSLSGAVVGPDGDVRYHVAVIGNDVDGASRWVVRTLMDELVLLLVADVDGCEVSRPEQRSATPTGLHALAVAC